jgi:acyl-CoA thioesterase-2
VAAITDSPSVPAVLRIEPAGEDRFVGVPALHGLPRVFGGQLLAQGLVAAARTVPDGRDAHSLHAYFLSGGHPARPLEYRVDRTRDGGRMSCRTVTVSQDGRVVAELMCSFATASGGVSHQRRRPAGPDADQVPALADALEPWGGLGQSWSGFGGVEIRTRPEEVDPRVTLAADPGSESQQVWQRVPDRMTDDALLHQAMLVYASDVTQLAASLVPHGIPLGVDVLPGRYWDGVSVDHAIWFHRPVRADQWLLFVQCSPSADAGRAFTRAEVFTADGTLVASVAQEGVIRDLPGPMAMPTPPSRAADTRMTR